MSRLLVIPTSTAQVSAPPKEVEAPKPTPVVSAPAPTPAPTPAAAPAPAASLDAIDAAKAKRAERFNIPLQVNELDKAAARAARFGITATAAGATKQQERGQKEKKAQRACYVFQASGNCEQGDSCRFLHVAAETEEAKAEAATKVAEVTMTSVIYSFIHSFIHSFIFSCILSFF